MVVACHSYTPVMLNQEMTADFMSCCE